MVDPLGGANHTVTNTYYGNGETGANNLACAGLLKSLTGPGTDTGNSQTVTTQYTNYDQMGRSLSTTDPAYHTFNSGYNAAGEVNSQSDGAHATGYTYDQLGRKGQLTYPDNTVELWSYDASGNVNTYTNRTGAVCTYQYDGRNRCTYYSWSANAAPAVSYEYDASGRMTRVFNSASDLHFVYDDSGAVIKEKALRYGQSTALMTTYTHDVDGNVDSILYPHGDKPQFVYDCQERCTQVVLNSTTLCAQHVFYPNGNWLLLRQLPYASLETAYYYQNNGRIRNQWHINWTTNTSIDLRSYGYSPDGQMSWYERVNDSGYLQGYNPSGSSLENGFGDIYSYYPDGSLYTALQNYTTSVGWPGEYSDTADGSVDLNSVVGTGAGSAPSNYDNVYYDAAGNRVGATLKNQQIPYADNGKGLNQYSSCGYDTNGNTSSDGLGWTYHYNAQNQLTSAFGPGGQVMYFDYDGLGRLSGENVNGVVLKTYFYAGSQRIEERDNSGNPIYQYFFDSSGSDQILFRRDETTWGNLWYLYDQFGNTTHLANDNGAVVEQYLYDANGAPTVYDAAGNVLPGGSAVDNRYLFRGAAAYQWYAPAGLYYARARFYQPYHGRWLQPDPIGQAGGLNIYTYCHNDPVNGVDPSGNDADTLYRGPEQSTGADPGTADSEDPRNATGVYATGDTPTGSHIPSYAYGVQNSSGTADILCVPWQGSTVLDQSNPYVTSAAIGGYTAVYPKDGDVRGGIGIEGTTQDATVAARDANQNHVIGMYFNGADSFWASWGYNLYAWLFSADNTDAAADIANASANYASQYGHAPAGDAYSQGNFALVGAIRSYGAQFSSLTFEASPVNILEEASAANQIGARFETNTAWGDVINIPAMGPNPFKFFSAFNPNAINIHTTHYPPHTGP